MNLNDLNVVFAGCAKNCAKFLPNVLQNINDYSFLFNKTFKIIVENGSTDGTKEILNSSKDNQSIIYFRDDLNLIDQRTIRLALARNLIIDEIKNNQRLKDFDLLIMIDFDDRGIFKIEEDNISKAIKFLYSKNDIAGVFGNQPDLYFDMWALQDQKNFKDDFFVNALKFAASKMRSTDKVNKEILLDLKNNYFDQKKNFISC